MENVLQNFLSDDFIVRIEGIVNHAPRSQNSKTIRQIFSHAERNGSLYLYEGFVYTSMPGPYAMPILYNNRHPLYRVFVFETRSVTQRLLGCLRFKSFFQKVERFCGDILFDLRDFDAGTCCVQMDGFVLDGYVVIVRLHYQKFSSKKIVVGVEPSVALCFEDFKEYLNAESTLYIREEDLKLSIEVCEIGQRVAEV